MTEERTGGRGAAQDRHGQSGREGSWREEDRSEEPSSSATRGDVGQSAEIRHEEGVGVGFSQERGPAGSLADASTETGVSTEPPADDAPRAAEASDRGGSGEQRGQTRPLAEIGLSGNDRLETGGHNSGARSPVDRREHGGDHLSTLNNPTESTPQRPE